MNNYKNLFLFSRHCCFASLERGESPTSSRLQGGSIPPRPRPVLDEARLTEKTPHFYLLGGCGVAGWRRRRRRRDAKKGWKDGGTTHQERRRKEKNSSFLVPVSSSFRMRLSFIAWLRQFYAKYVQYHVTALTVPVSKCILKCI